MNKYPDIILLNGTSSAGKTTLALALQDTLAEPYLYFSFDTLILATPRRYWQDSATPKQDANNPYIQDGVRMVEVQKENEPRKIQAVFGEYYQQVIHTMPYVVAELVKQGNQVIYDQIYHNQAMFEDCARILAPYSILHIGVHCPLAILEERERARGDRVLGRARGLFDIVHNFSAYDIEVDTHEATTEVLVAQIIEYASGCVRLNKN